MIKKKTRENVFSMRKSSSQIKSISSQNLSVEKPLVFRNSPCSRNTATVPFFFVKGSPYGGPIYKKNGIGQKKESSHFLLCSALSPFFKENQTNKKNGSRFSTTPLKAATKQEVVSITYEEIGLFPRSFSRVLDRFLKQVFSDVENLVIQEYRFYRYLFLTTLKCLLILFFVPFLVNFLAKSYVVRPLTEYFWNTKQTEIFLNSYQQKHAFAELKDFEEKLYFESLIYPKSVNGEEKRSSSFDFKPITNTMAPEITQKSYPSKTPNLDLELNKKQSSNTLFLESKKKNFSPQTSTVKFDSSHNIITKIKTVFIQKHGFRKKNSKQYFILNPAQDNLQRVDEGNAPRASVAVFSEHGESRKTKVFSTVPFSSLKKTGVSPFSKKKENLQRKFSSATGKFSSVPEEKKCTLIKSPSDFITSTCGKINNISMLRRNLTLLNQKSFFHPVAFFFEKGETPVFFKEENGTVEKPLVFRDSPCSENTATVAFFKEKGETPVLCENGTVVKPFVSRDSPFSSKKTGSLPKNLFTVEFNSNNSIDSFSDRLNRETKKPMKSIMSTSTPNTSLFVYQTIEADKNIQQRYQAKTIELAQRYNDQSVEAVTNLFGDIVSLATLFYLLYVLEIQINITQSFLLEVFFGLDDSKKSLLILLITDLLVGYHSSNLWELFFELFFNHYGLPESQTGIFLLVATLPVLLDVLFKYLIFRHLNRSSPATVATYHAIIE